LSNGGIREETYKELKCKFFSKKIKYLETQKKMEYKGIKKYLLK